MPASYIVLNAALRAVFLRLPPSSLLTMRRIHVNLAFALLFIVSLFVCGATAKASVEDQHTLQSGSGIPEATERSVRQ